MRIALVHAFTWPEVRRGGERLVDDLTAVLRRNGHVVDVFTGTARESVFHAGPSGRTYRMRIPWARPLAAVGLTRVETFGVRALVPLLLHRYDAIHAFTPTAALAGVAARRPTLYTVLGHPRPQGPPDGLRRRLLALAVARAGEVAALSTSAAASLEEAFGRTPIVLAPGVRTEEWTPRERAPDGPPRVLLSADRSNRDKQLDVLLDAFDGVLDVHPQARLQLSGPGSPAWALAGASPRVRAAVDDLGAGDPEDVAGRYRDATVTVLPSRDEAFGLALVESLACGTPAVGTTPGGARDILTDPGVGRLAPAGDAPALAAAVLEAAALAANPAAAARCRAHALAWDWERVLPSYLRAYEALRLEPARRSAAHPNRR